MPKGVKGFQRRPRVYPPGMEPIAPGLAPVPLLDAETIVSRALPRDRTPCGIYFLIDRGEIVYVGLSSNFHERQSNHRRSNKVWDSYYLVECPRGEMAELEKRYINAFMPKYNVDGKLFKSLESARRAALYFGGRGEEY